MPPRPTEQLEIEGTATNKAEIHALRMTDTVVQQAVGPEVNPPLPADMPPRPTEQLEVEDTTTNEVEDETQYPTELKLVAISAALA
ncbi:hypothetical protein MMC08_006606 [Hypocenomyce scalaris]|nr:hypothetical protein [Hypocenomyce scalaris]